MMKKITSRALVYLLLAAMLFSCLPGVGAANEVGQVIGTEAVNESTAVLESSSTATRADSLSSTAQTSTYSQIASMENTGDYDGAAAAAVTHAMPEVLMPEEPGLVDTAVGTLLQFTDGSAECDYTWQHKSGTETPTAGRGVLTGSHASSNDPQVAMTSHSLDHTIAATDIVEVRIKLTASSLTGTALNSRFFWSLSTELTGFDAACSAASTINANSEEYQTITYKIGEVSGAEGQVIGGIRLDYIETGETGTSSYEIDYIYIGPAESAPSQYEDYLFFDFTNDTAATNRYKSYTYGNNGTNYDAVDGWYKKNATSYDISGGEFQFKETTTDASPYLRTSASALSTDAGSTLQYELKTTDYLYFRLRHECAENNTASHTVTTKTKLYYWIDGTEQSINLGTYTITRYNSVVKVPLSAVTAGTMTAFQLAFTELSETAGTLYIDWIYIGAEENAPLQDHVFYSFNNSTADIERYKGKTYNGNTELDSAVSHWTVRTGTMDTNTKSISNGAFSVPLLPVETAQANTSNYYSHYVRNQPNRLAYAPSAGDYIQFRIKIDNAVSNRDDGQIQLGANLYWLYGNDSAYKAHSDWFDGSQLNNDYFTVTLPLSDEIISKGSIAEIRLQFNNIVPNGSETATISVDYIYIGQKETLPVQDFLFFDFENDPEDQARYRGETYGGGFLSSDTYYNFDTAMTGNINNWDYDSSCSTQPVIDNTAGALSFSTSSSITSDCTIHTIITSKSNGHPLKYSPGDSDYFAVRMKIEGASDTSVNFRLRAAINGGTSSDTILYSTAIDSSWVNEGYFVLSGSLNDTFHGANEINAIRPEVYDLTGATGITFTYDYIYVGPEAYLPSTDGDALFIDFRNDTAAQDRYVNSGSEVYGGINFDYRSRYFTNDTATATSSSSGEGTMTLTANGSRKNFYAEATGSDSNGSNKPLYFRPEVNDVVQMRFKLTGTPDTATAAALYFQYDDNSVDMGSSTRVVDSVTSNVIFTGEYYIMNLEMPDVFTHATRINAIRPYFSFNEASGVEAVIDYIYIGPQESAPYGYQVSRQLSSVDTSGENYRITYQIDMFKPSSCGQIRLKELLQPEFKLLATDGSTGADAVKVYTQPYISQGNYETGSSTKTLVSSPKATVKTENSDTVIRLSLDEGDTAYRRDNYGDTVTGYRYIVEINFAVDHDYTLGGNNALVNLSNNSWTSFHPRQDGSLTADSELREAVNFGEENLNIAFAEPVAHDFFMELYDTESAAASYTAALNAIDGAFADDLTVTDANYSTYQSSLLAAGQKLDLVEALNYQEADGSKNRTNAMIFGNMLTNAANGSSNLYTDVIYWVAKNDGDTQVELDYTDMSPYLYYREATYDQESTAYRYNAGSGDFDLLTDQLITVRAFYTPSSSSADSLGRSAYGKYSSDLNANKEAYAYYYAPKFAVVDLGATVSVNMQAEGQQIGTWDKTDGSSQDVVKDYGFHLLSKNGQIDIHLCNIKYNFRLEYMDDGDRTLLSEPEEVYYLTRSEKGEKGASKRTIASFETQVAELLEGTGVDYYKAADQLDHYYDTSVNSLTGALGDATQSPEALLGSYYTTLRSLTVIPANNVFYNMDKFRVSGWSATGKKEADLLQGYDYDNGFEEPYGNDNNWYAAALDGEDNVGDGFQHSWGRAYKLTSTAENNASNRANFTFYGTGFELYSHTTPDTGVMVVEVYAGSTYSAIGDNTNLVRRYFVDTYLADNSLYQVPVVVCNDLDYGQYTVRVRGFYTPAFDHNYTVSSVSGAAAATKSAASSMTEAKVRQILGLSEEDLLTFIPSASGYKAATRSTVTYRGYYDVYVDSFRIFNPLGDVLTEEEHPMEYYAYALSNEVCASGSTTETEFYNVKNDLLLDRSTWTGNSADGVLYLGDGTTSYDEDDTVSDGLRLGMEGSLNTQADYLFFDFGGSEEDDTCYENSVYGGCNFDETASWVYRTHTMGAHSISGGALTSALLAEQPTDSSPYSHYLQTKGYPLNYRPAAGDCLQMRLKIDNAVLGGTYTQMKIGAIFNYAAATSTWSGLQYEAVDIAAVGKGYFTVNIPLDDAVTAYETITSVRLRFDCFTNAEGEQAQVTVDYVYVGPQSTVPAEDDHLFFDFTDSDHYNSSAYGYQDGDDAAAWQHRTNTMNADVISIAEPGTLSSVLLATAVDTSSQPANHYFRVNKLQYNPTAGDRFQMRIKLDKVSAAWDSGNIQIGAGFYSVADPDGDTTLYQYLYETFALEDVADQGYFLVNIPLTEKVTNFNEIVEVRLQLNGILPIDGETSQITVDWVYVGPEEKLPAQEYFFADFTGKQSDLDRYTNKTYGGQNFDSAENWQQRTYTMNDDAVSTSAYGTISATLLDSIASTVESPSNHYIRAMGLNYIPEAGDCFQMRIRLDGMTTTNSAGKVQIGAGFYSILNTKDVELYDFQYQEFVLAEVVNKGYFMVNIPLNDEVTAYEQIEEVRLQFNRIDAAEGDTAKFTIDWVYVGPTGFSRTAATGSVVKDNYLRDSNGSLLSSRCHQALISWEVSESGVKTYYCECQSRHALEGNARLAVGHDYLLDTDGSRILSCCHSMPISRAYDGSGYTHQCVCDGSAHDMGRTKLLESGVVFYDDAYEIDGPENEIYLKNGHGIAFDVGTSDRVQISLKSTISREMVQLYAWNGTEMVNTGIYSQITPQMYFNIPSAYIIDGSVYLMCVTSGDAMMSICTIKVFNGTKPTVKAGMVKKAIELFATDPETPSDETVTDSSLAIKSASLSLQSDISMNFYVADSVLEGWSEPYMVFTKALYSESGAIVGYETEEVRDFVQKTAADGTACHVYSFCGIDATEMASVVTAKLCATKDGVVYEGAELEYSVQQYAQNQLAATQDAQLQTLLVDLLNYGTEAQKYFSYNSANPANGSLTVAQRAMGTQTEAEAESCIDLSGNDVAAVGFDAATLLLEEKVTMKFYLDLSDYGTEKENLYAVLRYDDVSVTIDGSEFTEDDGIYFSGLNAAQMRTPVTVEIYSSTTGEQVSGTLIYSIESYVAAKLSDSSLNPLVSAMLNYGDSVVRYFQ